ncbi:hypothetical protein P43SY_007540 [Pythium insidiosum]|uniref:FYVE-type domain-containing protein n=1 Tax=Pythium insidiosum TaxID=114742 RepID=A0AAD5LFB6_PYTIN|nr:hypothetical protein P43SY_007540 [Pythium insidiosum]
METLLSMAMAPRPDDSDAESDLEPHEGMPVMAPAAAGARGKHARHELRTFIPEGRWKLDASCGICGVHFGYLRGRHHCRYCGMSVCGKHSRSRAVVPTSMSAERQRVCDVCYPKCQYGLPLMRRRGYTTADGVPMTTRTNNGLDFEIDTSTDSRLYRSARGRSQRARTVFRLHDTSDDAFARPDHYHASPVDLPMPKTVDAAAPQRRRGQSEPPEQTSVKIIPRRHKFPLPSPTSHQSPPPSPAASAPFQPDQPSTKPLNLDKIGPAMHSSQDLWSLSASSSPVGWPQHDSNLDSSYGPVRDTKDQDALAMQYLSFAKGDITTLETSRLVVSHERTDPFPFDATVMELQPAPELQFEMHDPLAATAISPLRSAAKKPQNRLASSSSTCTVSVSDSDELNEEKPLENAAAEWDVGGGRVSDTVTEESASFFGDDDIDDSQSDVEPPSPLPEPTVEVEAGDEDTRALLNTGVPTVVGEEDSVITQPLASKEEIELQREVMELEWRIRQLQMELPVLLEQWRRVENIAKCQREEARESRDKVRRYEKARAVVSHAVRSACRSLEAGEHEAAILALTRAAGIERTNAKVWFLLAQARFKVGELEPAEEACRISLELQSSAAASTLLGRILHAQGRHDEAIQCYLTSLGR